MAPQSAFYDPPYTPTHRRSASPASSDGIGAYRPAGTRRPAKASRRAPWTAEQDAILVDVIQAHLRSSGNTEIAWTTVGKLVSKRLGENGMRRCGKRVASVTTSHSDGQALPAPLARPPAARTSPRPL